MSSYSMGTCVLNIMWLTAGARSTRRLMAIHAGASRHSNSPPSSKCSQQAGGERANGALHTHPGWEHFMIITIIFSQKIIHSDLCQSWIAKPLEHMVQILCGKCGESGRMPLWNCSADKAPPTKPPLFFFSSVPWSISICLICCAFSFLSL